MADSEKDKTQTDKENPSGITTLAVVNQHGHVREQQRDVKTGRILPKPRPLIPTIEFVRGRRKRLAKVNDKGLTEDIAIVEELLEIVHAPLRDTKGNIDAKLAMAKVKAAETIWLYTGGKPDPSEREMDKLTTQPVKTIIVVSPDLMNPQVVDGDKPANTKTQPSFAEITGVTTNEK